MTKTPKQMAREYAITRELFDPHRITFDSRLWLEQGFLAGYHAAKDHVADVSKVMNSPNNSNGWISVKERLPEVNTWCLWLYPTGPEVNQYEGKLDDGTMLFHRNWYDFEDTDITHWMLLPEPPKEEE